MGRSAFTSLLFWTAPLLGLCGCLLAAGAGWAQEGAAQYGAAVEAMLPPPAPVRLPNPLQPPPVLSEQPRLRPKAALRQLAAQPAAPETPPVTPAPTGPAPEPSVKPATTLQAPADNSEKVTLQADEYEMRQGVSRALGHVELKYQDYTLRSDEAELDKDRRWSTLDGNVELLGPDYRGRGKRLRFNLQTDEWQMDEGRVTIQPEFLTEGLAEPFYMQAVEAAGEPERVVGRTALGTSCDRETDPHYALRSSEVTVIPDQRVTFRRPTLYLFGHRLVRYPWDLSLSLQRKENRFLPEFGQNDVEGYYLKFALGYLLNEANSGFVRLHLTQNRGVGFGLDHLLDTPRQSAELSFFMEPAEGSVTGRLNDQLKLSRPFTSQVTVNWQSDSGYSSGTESLSSDLTFHYDDADSNSLLGFQHSLTSSTYSTSRRFTSTLTQRQRLGKNGEWQFRSTMTSSSYSATVAPNEELNTDFTYRHRGALYDTTLLAQKRYDLDGSRYTGDDTYYALNRTPDLNLVSDGQRFSLLRWLVGRDSRATFYLGRFEQQPDDLRLYRTGLDLELPSHSYDLSQWSTLRTAGQFQQMFYTDGSAQWVAQLQSDLTQKLSGTWQSRLTFSYGRPNGYAPLRIDYASPTSTAQLQIVRLLPDRLRLEVSGGRDFHNNYFNDIVMRSELMLTPRNRLEMQGGYSLETAAWRPINLRWIYATAHAWYSALSVNYDLEDSELTRLSADVDWSPSALWRVQFLGGYGSYSGVDQADFRITRDLHCLVAQATYIYASREFQIGLGIKAFPSETRTFGIGGTGGAFDSGFSDQY